MAGCGAEIHDPRMKFIIPRIACAVLSAALLSLVTAGCQTSRGFGKDVEKLGEKIQDKSK
jgi:predicted small secreted protein